MNPMDRIRFPHIIISFLLISGVLSVVAQPAGGASSNKLRKVVNNTFKTGELLSYRIHYGFINAAKATLEVAPDFKNENGRECYHIICKTNSVGAWDAIYRIRDTYESYTDKNALVSIRFNRDIQEGGYKSYREIHFDQFANTAYYHSKKKVTTYDVPPNVQDVISTFYYARTVYQHNKLDKGTIITLSNFIDETLFDLKAEVLGRETIKVAGKKYKALRLKVMIEEAGLLTDGSKITLWLSDDKNLIPLRFKSKLFIGSLKADIISAKNLKHPFEAQLES